MERLFLGRQGMETKQPTLVDIIVQFLEQYHERAHTAREIAEWIYEKYPERCQQKKERSKAIVTPLESEKDIIRQLAAEVSAKSADLQLRQIKITEDRPKKYYFEKTPTIVEITQPDNFDVGKLINKKIKEFDLYPMLDQFLKSEFGIYSKRIDEKRSRNAGGKNANKWLHPDLVAMEDLIHGWHDSVKECFNQYANKKAKLWSFEVKLSLNRSNLREAFFQTVSNSSWANVGYLVAGSMEGESSGNALIKELRMLAGLHGIGLMLLNTDNPSESQILIPAQEKHNVDWVTANRIAQENADFREYLDSISDFYRTDKVHPSNWENNYNEKTKNKDKCQIL
ncbi:MAG: hypothetical protein K0R12_1032 [Gammaproteobacteria bacterium]|jgi:hypothetical protein|nr:hypothetical protein [Gammaproteobacteria bacterium]